MVEKEGTLQIRLMSLTLDDALMMLSDDRAWVVLDRLALQQQVFHLPLTVPRLGIRGS
jgi:hypothetical protein